MGPTVVADLVPFGDGALEDFGMFLRVLPDHENRDVNVPFLQQIEQLRGQRGAGAIVKGHGDVGFLDPHGRGVQHLLDGTTRELRRENLIAPLDGALRALAFAAPLLAVGLIVLRL